MSIYDINREQDYVKNSGGILGENELRPPSQLHFLLEKTEPGFLSEKIFETVSLSSDSLFQRAVSILHTSYLDSASEHGFQYSQVTLVKNDIFLNEYKTFYQEKKSSNYTQEELQETYGFLLFETENQAKLVCQRGLCVGSSARTTLGDPAKGVYISKYSDYLHARPWYHGKSGYVVIFNLIKYYLYELSGSSVIERPRQICPYVIVAFQYREPKRMAASARKSIFELSENALTSSWQGKLIIQGCLLCDISLWSSYGTAVPKQLPHELDFKYVMKVSSLKKRLPEAAFRKQNYLEQKVCCQDMCFRMYEVELSNKQGEKIDKLTEYIKNKQLAIIKCLEDRGFFILLTSSALIPETHFGGGQTGLHGLHLFHPSLPAGLKELKGEDDISSKVTPILPALNCALLEAKKSFTEEGVCPNTLVKHGFQELYKVDQGPSLTATSQDGIQETAFFGQLSDGFDLVPPAEKCPSQSLTQLKSYFSDPSGYVLEVSTALDLLADRPQSPCISDGICDAAFSLVMTPDPEFLDSEVEVRKETETEKNPEEMFKARQGALVPLSAASNLRVQPKRKASVPPTMQSKRVSLCRSFPKRNPAGASKGSDSPATLKLVKGPFPQKRKREGADMPAAQFVQTTTLHRKEQAAPVSKDAPLATNTKRARKQEKSPVKTVPRAKPPMKKSPQKQRVNLVKGNQNPRIRKQPQPAKGETGSQLPSEISSVGQEDVISINATQTEDISVAQKDLPENSIVNCDSQALNLLADLALSAATSTTPPSEPRNFPCASESPQNDVLLSKEHSVCGTSDHEYHRGVKNQKGGLLPKPSSEKKSSPAPDSPVSQEEESVAPVSPAPVEAASALSEETLESNDGSQSSFVAVEHSYALLLAEHSKKHLQQRGTSSPAFAKNSPKGPEAGTPVGKVMPFRHQQSASPLQKLSEDLVLKRRSRLLSSSLKDFHCSHTVFCCDGSFKVTFKCDTEYVFSLDSKYTNNPLEKTVIRALHGPWNTDLPDNVEEVKLLLHMWVALFYSNQNKVIRSSRKVVEHSNPAKYVSINSTLESFEFSEIEESSSVERCSVDPLLETSETPTGHAADMSFPDTNSLLPFMKPPPTGGLEFWVQNEQKEIFAEEGHPVSPESQNFIYSCNNEIMGGKAKQDPSDKLETSNLGSTQTNGPSIPSEDKTFEPLDSTRVTHNDTITQTTFSKTYDGLSSQSVTCQKSVYSTLESKVDIFHAAVQTKTSALQGLIQQSSPMSKECQPSLESKDDTEYVMINLEPVTFTFEKNTYVPIQTEVANRSDEPTTFNTELIKQVSPAPSLRHPVSFEKAQTQGLRDVPSPAMSKQKGTKYLCASSVSKETLAKEMCSCSLQKEIPAPSLSSPSDNSRVAEALSLVKSSNYSSPREEMKLTQEFFLQTQSLLGISSEEIIEPSQVEEVVSASASTTLGRNASHNCIPPKGDTAGSSSEPVSDRSALKSEHRNFEPFDSAFTKQTSLSVSREEASLEFSEDDSDIDLTLTISPPTSPREEMPAGGLELRQEAPVSNLELQDATEEIIRPEEVTLLENPEVDSADFTSVFPTVPEKSLESKERKGDNLQTVTLILSKETCALEIAEEVNVTSDFPFASLIEEVSPASSPDPQDPVEAAQPSQALPLCSLQLADTQRETNARFSRIESVDSAFTEKGNSFVGPVHPVGQDNLTRVQQMQLSAEMPLVGSKHPERKDGHLTLPGKVTEEIVPGEHGEGEGLSFSEKVPCCDTELGQPAPAAKHGEDIKPSLEKLVTSGNPLQPVSVQNRNLSPLVLETGEPPFSPRKMTENKFLADTFVSTTAPSGTVNVSLRQPTSPKSIKNLFSSDGKTDEGVYVQAQSLSSGSVGGADTRTHGHSEIPKLAFPSDGAALPHCPRPTNTETGFQTQEVSVVRMASLLKNSDTEAKFHEEITDLGSVDSQSSTTSPKGKQKTIHGLQDRAVCETKDLLNAGLFPMCVPGDSYHETAITGENTSREPCASVVPQSCAPLVGGVSEEQTADKGSGEGLRAEEDSGTVGGGVGVCVNSDVRCEPLSAESDLDSWDCRNPKSEGEASCTLRYSQTKKEEDASKEDYDSFLSLNNSDNEEWGYSAHAPGLETGIAPRHWLVGFKKEERCVPSYIQIRDLRGIPRTYANFTVTRELTDTTRTLHSLKRHPNFTAKCGLLSSWTDTWQVADDLTQNTLDLEYLRFAHKLKQIVKKGDSHHSASSTNVFPKEPPLTGAGAFPLTTVPESPALHLASRSRSPLVVTVVHSGSRQQGPRRTGHALGSLDSSSFWKESCGHNRNHLANSERNQTVSFHLNKLKYNTTLKESRNDISLILNEYAEFNKVMMNSNPVVFPEKESTMASGEASSRELYSSFPRAASYEDMITDLCTSLHVKLKSVVQEACKSPFLFYVLETEDQSFFVRTKSVLRKGGHTEIDLQHFCQGFHRENDTLLVVIRNEDIASHLHQIPSLLKLKHFPSVLFAGVDGPEDVLEYTYQELFQTGGFVVSDDKILETATLAQLKDMVRTLEKLNRNGRWKWLLHHRENKKLRQDVRVDSVARKKNLILKSYQSANLIELLPYHQCDSRAPSKAEHLKCLLNLQIQHIHARFAVFLTEKPTVSREVFENSGILVTDVNNFIENIPKIAAPFRSSYW
ncbi:protein TASOR 2 isoform X3 [Callorhinus ursinus]|uniref:protein TASOR 2 isoform X3 n=1 Tax=Callorhinus ursinus TaxID=34884 RepID=UPI003CD00C98